MKKKKTKPLRPATKRYSDRPPATGRGVKNDIWGAEIMLHRVLLQWYYYGLVRWCLLIHSVNRAKALVVVPS